jgi:Homeodomain-like domain
MKTKRYLVQLSPSDREQLKHLIAAGTAPARTLMHARILLKLDISAAGPQWTDDATAAAVEVSRATVERVRTRFATQGLGAALHRKAPEREYASKLDGAQEAHLVALACGDPPEGQARWSLRLLADKMVELEYVDTLSYETVRQTLKKTNSSPG